MILRVISSQGRQKPNASTRTHLGSAIVKNARLVLFFSSINNNDSTMYFICGMLGFSTGFWAIFITMGARTVWHQPKGNCRYYTIPNMVRGALPLINLMFLNLFQKSWGWSLSTKWNYYRDCNYGYYVYCFLFYRRNFS